MQLCGFDIQLVYLSVITAFRLLREIDPIRGCRALWRGLESNVTISGILVMRAVLGRSLKSSGLNLKSRFDRSWSRNFGLSSSNVISMDQTILECHIETSLFMHVARAEAVRSAIAPTKSTNRQAAFLRSAYRDELLLLANAHLRSKFERHVINANSSARCKDRFPISLRKVAVSSQSNVCTFVRTLPHLANFLYFTRFGSSASGPRRRFLSSS